MIIRQRYIGEVKEGRKEVHIQKWKDQHDGMDISLELRPRALIMRTVEVTK